MTGCGCSNCGGARRDWLSVTGAWQGAAGPIAAPVPFMEGIGDPEAIGELPSQYVGRACASVYVDGRPASDPCSIMCGPFDHAKWKAAAREMVAQLQGPLAGSVTKLGLSGRVVELAEVVDELHGHSSTEEIASSLQELACIGEDARGVPSIDPPPPPPPSIGTSPPITMPSWEWPKMPTVASLVPEWVWWVGGGLLVYMVIGGGSSSSQPNIFIGGGRHRDD